MPRRRKRKFEDAEVATIGLVDHGANRRYWSMRKRSKDMTGIVKDVVEAPLDDAVREAIEPVTKALDDAGREAAEAVAGILHAFTDTLPKDAVSAIAKSLGYDAPAESENESETDPLPAGLPDEAKAAFEAMAKRQAEIEKQLQAERAALAKERAERRREELVAKARRTWKHVGKADELADLYLRAEGADEELAESLKALLDRVEGRLRTSKMLDVVGSDADGEALDPVHAALAAAGKVRKAKEDVPLADAVGDVFRADPDLYARYRAEAMGRR